MRESLTDTQGSFRRLGENITLGNSTSNRRKKVLLITRKTFTNSTLVIHKVAYHVCRLILTKFELHHEKIRFLHMRKQRRRSATIQLISAFTVTAFIVQSLYFLNKKFQASSHLLWLHSPVCVRPGQKPQRQDRLYCHVAHMFL